MSALVGFWIGLAAGVILGAVGMLLAIVREDRAKRERERWQ